ncbi:bifunctional 5,10-methylenetetrahydrofolate dehydrogenase/5,10-methenyltetrahydrofolate cyclohydrolase [Patescibacteria group bacterium]|nr:bifunctional 5,10-methylenetetrahydrofolate dehydrogenase/5,10-methenyltetrahydrofolate cyclohydrolase [Patescibacteria group bacterium]
MIIKGVDIANRILEDCRQKLQSIKGERRPHLAVILVGHNKASRNFVQKKEEQAQKLGLDFSLFDFPENITQEELVRNLEEIQGKDEITCVILQLPLPQQINTPEIIERIDPRKDVDCLTSTNLCKSQNGQIDIHPPTPAAILEIIKEYQILLDGKHVVVIGKGRLVGKPLVTELMKTKATLSVCDKSTPDLENFTKSADIIISGAGAPHLLTQDMVKEGVVIIDAGTSYKKGVLCGDTDCHEIQNKASLVTPVPGGVGPVTVAKLFENCLKLSCG